MTTERSKLEHSRDSPRADQIAFCAPHGRRDAPKALRSAFRKSASAMPPSPPKKAKEEDASKKPTKADTKIKTLSGDVAELSEEDQALQKEMELLVERVRDPVKELRKAALEKMVEEVRTSTSSMTSVPKPLKFLRPHFPALKLSLIHI